MRKVLYAQQNSPLHYSLGKDRNMCTPEAPEVQLFTFIARMALRNHVTTHSLSPLANYEEPEYLNADICIACFCLQSGHLGIVIYLSLDNNVCIHRADRYRPEEFTNSADYDSTTI